MVGFFRFLFFFFFTVQLCCGVIHCEGNAGCGSTALLNTDRTFQDRDMTLSVAVADAVINFRGPVLVTEGLCTATNPPC